MKKIFSSLLLIVLFPFRLLKKSKIDNFVGGLIVGAVFSLIVNIFTVKTQEIINRQRVLEALEREMTYHVLLANNMYDQASRTNSLDDENFVNDDSIFYKRFQNRVWNTSEAMKYLFELDPKSASEIEIYYDVTIDGVNKLLDKNLETYKKLYEPCEPFYSIITGKDAWDNIMCNKIARDSALATTQSISLVTDSLTEVKKVFHPTHDRLDNFFLKTLMGNQSVEILKDIPQ